MGNWFFRIWCCINVSKRASLETPLFVLPFASHSILRQNDSLLLIRCTYYYIPPSGVTSWYSEDNGITKGCIAKHAEEKEMQQQKGNYSLTISLSVCESLILLLPPSKNIAPLQWFCLSPDSHSLPLVLLVCCFSMTLCCPVCCPICFSFLLNCLSSCCLLWLFFFLELFLLLTLLCFFRKKRKKRMQRHKTGDSLE